MKKWVVIKRGKTSRLKCLRCGWRWKSNKNYVALLPDWTEESRSGMTDADVLARLKDGSLIVDVKNAVVSSCVNNQGQKNGHVNPLRVIERQPPGCGGPYRFVEICRRGKKKKVAVHKLVWMAVTMRLIPAGHDVDHRKGVRSGDGIGNLRLLKSSVNRATNRAKKAG